MAMTVIRTFVGEKELLRKAEMTGIRKSRVSRLCEELDSGVE